MKRLLHRGLTVGASVALGATTLMGLAPPAGASPPASFAYGSFAAPGSPFGVKGMAQAPPAQTTVVYNVNFNGLLSTGTTTDTAGAVTAFSKVTYPSASTSWTVGSTTYTLAFSARLVEAYCNDSTGTPHVLATIAGGKLTESAVTTATGVQTDYQVFNLPANPAANQAYSYHTGLFVLNTQSVPLGGGKQTDAIAIVTPSPQVLVIAVAGCGGGGRGP
jgi:hypothetical protein